MSVWVRLGKWSRFVDESTGYIIVVTLSVLLMIALGIGSYHMFNLVLWGGI